MHEAVKRFDEVAGFLSTLDVPVFWEHATATERQTLIKDVVDSVFIYPDQVSMPGPRRPWSLLKKSDCGLVPNLRCRRGTDTNPDWRLSP